MKNYLFFTFLILAFNSFAQETVTALPNAHAHNDYEHEHPLFDALRHGFTSIEADVHLIGGKIYVAHDTPEDLDKTPTLQALYLDPLRQWIRQHEGRVYPNYEAPILLMIDIKTKAPQSGSREIYANWLASDSNPRFTAVIGHDYAGNISKLTACSRAGKMGRWPRIE